MRYPVSGISPRLFQEEFQMFENAVKLLKDSAARHDFPGAAYAVGIGDKVLLKGHFGVRQEEPEVLELKEDTLFDMASLSKILGTTLIALRYIEQGKLFKDNPLDKMFK